MAIAFYDLDIWKKSFELTLGVYRITTNYPPVEKYNLVSQTRSAANSVCANIAEAHGRYYYADRVRVLYQARGEVEEVRSHFRVAWKLGYLNEDEFDKLDSEYEGLSKGISAYIKSLSKKKR